MLQVPKACKCGATEFEPLEGTEPLIREMETSLDGVKCYAIHWQRCKCQCGQHVSRRLYDPNQPGGRDAA